MSSEKGLHHLYTYFLANVSHEFRTPLSALNASIELLMDEINHLSPNERDSLLQSIHLSVTRLQLLVDNLLETATLEAGQFHIHRQLVSMNKIMADAIQVMQPLLDRRNQSLLLTEPLALPAVLVDPIRLTQVFINLLSNASKYSPIGSAVEIRLSLKEKELWVVIADRGPGVDPSEREHLFDGFVRLGKNTRDQYGIGLGLSIVKAVIEGHGGKVAIQEHEQGGAIFCFSLPLENTQR